MTPEETDPDLPVSVQESLAEVWVSGGLLKVGGTACSSACMEAFEEGHHYLYYLQDSLASGQKIGRKHKSTEVFQQKIGLKIY